MKNNKNNSLCPVPTPTLGGATLIEINAKTLSRLGFKHLPCSRERFGSPMVYYGFIKENNTHFIVVFDRSYSIYRLTEPLLIKHLNSMSFYYVPCSVSERHYVQYYDFLGVDNA